MTVSVFAAGAGAPTVSASRPAIGPSTITPSRGGLLDPSVRWQSRVGEGYVDTPALAALRRRRAGWLGEAIATTIELVDPDTTVIFGYLGTDDDVRNCLSIIDARCAATLDGRQGRVLHRDSPASIWDAASAALVLDDFLCRPTRYDRSLLT
ncbi:hypothetical protein JOF29_007200 [Kribbella aluminosa]|uniref:Uncharacterized protein n=1 Tax=Kribbella aluminosa TaxID=416017 RepID=A0ABS4UWR5_9ACTN|nr:hypothetical protein [Kribbella aluminosa]MBP2356090.1 hypothetical protein [Kribbella aluminosa]